MTTWVDDENGGTVWSEDETGGRDVSSFVETLLDDATSSEAQTTLGISAFAQTVLDDPSAAAAATTLGVPSLVNLAASTGAGLVGFIQSGTGAPSDPSTRTVAEKLGEAILSVKDCKNDDGTTVSGNGSQDDTTGIQKAFNTGRPVYFPPGTYKTTSTLTLTTAAAHGQLIYGAGPTSGSGTGADKTIIKPSSAVSQVFKIDGSGISLAIQNGRMQDFTVDMTNMTDDSSHIAFRQMSAYGWTYTNVHTINEGSNKRSWKFETGSFTTTLINCRGTIVEFSGTSLANAVTTTNLIGCDIVSIPFSYVVGLNIYGGQLNGTADKITGSNINGLTVIGVDVEGASGNFLNFGSTCAHILCQGNEFSGFSGTYSTGTPTKYALLDYQAGFSTGGNSVTINDGKLSVINSAAALCRQLIQASNGTSQQVDIELKNGNGSTFIGQNATGDTTLDARGTGVISFQQSGTVRLGVDASQKLIIGTLTQTTVGAAGGASALPATPSGYARFKIGSSEFVFPYYAQA